MIKLCSSCLFIGPGRHGLFSGNKYIGSGQILLGVALIATNYSILSWTDIVILVIAIFSIIVGILNIRDSRQPGKICPRCNNMLMIDIDTEEAQQIIKANNLTVPGS